MTNSGSFHSILGVLCSLKLMIYLRFVAGKFFFSGPVLSVLLGRFVPVLTWSHCAYTFILLVPFWLYLSWLVVVVESSVWWIALVGVCS